MNILALEHIDAGGARLVGWPRTCPRAAYDRAATAVAEAATALPNVRAVYRMGNVSAPGISDLDLVLVVEDGTALTHFAPVLDEEARYTLMHSVFVVPERFWARRHLFYTYDNLTLLAGDDIAPVVEENDAWRHERDLRMAIQHLIRVAASLVAQRAGGVIPVRSTLCELNALRFDCAAVQPYLPVPEHAGLEAAVRRIGELRAHWFECPEARATRFHTVYGEALHAVSEVLRTLTLPPVEESALDQVALSRQRLVERSKEGFEAVTSWGAGVSRLVARLPVPDRVARAVGRRLGQCHLRIPATTFDWAAGDLVSDHLPSGALREAQQRILRSPEVAVVRQRSFSFPVLSFGSEMTLYERMS